MSKFKNLQIVKIEEAELDCGFRSVGKYQKADKKNVYQIVTGRVIESLKKGLVPWKKSWKVNPGSGNSYFPENFVSKKNYRGINFFLLLMTSVLENFSSNYWLTFLQCKDLGGHIKKGSVCTPVCFFKYQEIKEDIRNVSEAALKRWTDDEIRQGFKIRFRPILRYFNVFNLNQTEGIEIPFQPDHEEPLTGVGIIKKAEAIVKGYQDGPAIGYGYDRCFYDPLDDFVGLPYKKDFLNLESFYEVTFHELAHSTGHSKRLNRKELYSYKSELDKYSYEELVAEMTDCFLCNIAGISGETFENSAAYIQNWLHVFENDEKFVVQAASQAQKAADWILNQREHL